MSKSAPGLLPAYRADIDGLRAIAIVLVVMFHLTVGFTKGGYVGVDVFFVISGFLITGLVVKDVEAGRFSFGHFYERRIRRLFPALFASLLAASVFAWFILFPPELDSFGKQLASAIGFVANLFFFSGSGYFADDSTMQPLHHTWSLAVEEQFYLFFPLILLPLVRLQRRHLIAVLWVGALASFALSVLWMKQDNAEGAFYLLPARAWELLVGALLAVGGVPEIRAKWLRDIAGGAGVIAILVAAGAFNKNVAFPGWSALVPCLGAALIIHSGKARDTRVHALLSLRPVVLVGLASYSIYVWHMPLIVLYKSWFDLYLSVADRLILGTLSLALGFLSWRFIERPFRFGGLLPTRRALFGGAALAMVAGLAIAAVLVLGHGFENRFSPEIRAMAAWRYVRPQELADGRCFVSRAQSADPRVDPACLTPDPAKKNYLLLGDSHADHWWSGWEGTLPGIHLMEATASGCKPMLRDIGAARCRAVMNRVFHEYLQSHKIDGIILSALWTTADLPDLPPTIQFLRQFTDTILVVGPVPTYEDKLPRLLMRAALRKDPGLIDRSRLASRFDIDRAFAEKLSGEPVTYLSVMRAICEGKSCAVRAPDGEPMQFDYGHMTASGARYVAQRFLELGAIPLQR